MDTGTKSQVLFCLSGYTMLKGSSDRTTVPQSDDEKEIESSSIGPLSESDRLAGLVSKKVLPAPNRCTNCELKLQPDPLGVAGIVSEYGNAFSVMVLVVGVSSA